MTNTALIAQNLILQHRTLATAESCTGGLIAHHLTNISGSSTWFKGGVIAYANEVKTSLLNVPPKLILKHGAVSAEVAQRMAQGVRGLMRTDLAISVTGIAGPKGATPQKPVGLVFISATSSSETLVKKYLFKGSRTSIKKQAAKAALNLLCILIS